MAVLPSRPSRRRESNGKRLSHPRLDHAGNGSLKDVSRKVFEAARRTRADNAFKQCFEQSLDNTHRRGSRTADDATEVPGNNACNVALDAAIQRESEFGNASGGHYAWGGRRWLKRRVSIGVRVAERSTLTKDKEVKPHLKR